MTINLQAAWIGFFLGCVAGAVPGLFFHRPEWLGGYVSWRRRMIRLAHISFFGLGGINLGFGLTVPRMSVTSGLTAVSILLIVGAVSMPAVCYLSAWRPGFRHIFFIPAGSVTLGVGLFMWRLILQ